MIVSHMKKSEHTWKLKRRDDHGNQYIMASYDSEEEARNMMKEYESRRHKQTYWIEKSETKSGLDD